jgi:hypothetical protein
MEKKLVSQMVRVAFFLFLSRLYVIYERAQHIRVIVMGPMVSVIDTLLINRNAIPTAIVMANDTM